MAAKAVSAGVDQPGQRAGCLSKFVAGALVGCLLPVDFFSWLFFSIR